MKRSEFVAGFKVPHVDTVARAIFLAEKAGVTWDPEEPEGFQEWWGSQARISGSWVLREHCLAAWNACLAHAKEKRQGKQWFEGMTFEEIDAHLEAGTFPGAMTPGSWVRVPSDFMTWRARKSRQEAQERTIEPKVDPEVRRKEIEAQIEAWADFQASIVPTGMKPWRDLWAAAGRCLIRNCLRGGVL